MYTIISRHHGTIQNGKIQNGTIQNGTDQEKKDVFKGFYKM